MTLVTLVRAAVLLDEEDQQGDHAPDEGELDQQVHSSPLPRRHFELRADRPPHLLRRDARGQRLVDRTAAERLQDVVVRDGAGVPRSEVVLHPDPELRQPHGDQGRSIDPDRRVGCTLEQVFG